MFKLGIGADIVIPCPVCKAEVALDVDDRAGGACEACNNHLEFPDLGRSPTLACYACLRAGGAAMTKDTELGMIRHEDALLGVTHGVPGLDRADFEPVPKGDGWTGARLPISMMQEFLQTPAYHTIQGERWLFRCNAPMVYDGQCPAGDYSVVTRARPNASL